MIWSTSARIASVHGTTIAMLINCIMRVGFHNALLCQPQGWISIGLMKRVVD